MRASDPRCALLSGKNGGGRQDPLYIARRMVVFASEDIGMAQPTALVVANEVFRFARRLVFLNARKTWPTELLLSSRQKDRSAYNAYIEALLTLKSTEFARSNENQKSRNKTHERGRLRRRVRKYDTESYLPEKLKGKKYFKR